MMTAASASKKNTSQAPNEQLHYLMEIFPTWKQEDLNSVLNEAAGDVYLAINRISEGHVNQWSDSKAKQQTSPATNFESQRSQPRKPAPKQAQSGRKAYTSTEKPVERKSVKKATEPLKPIAKKSAPTNDIANPSWDTPAVEDEVKKPVATAVATTKKTSFADALTGQQEQKEEPKKTTKNVKKPVEAKKVEEVAEEKKLVVEEEKVVVEAAAAEEPVQQQEQQKEEVAVQACNDPCACSAQIIEEDYVVKMPTRSTPSLTMEQPAVILPIRAPMRTGLSVRFGFEREEEAAAVSVPTALLSSVSAEPTPTPEPPVSTQKTPISVAALESSFAMLSATVKEEKNVVEAALFESQTTTAVSGAYLRPNHPAEASYAARGPARSSGWDYEGASTSTSATATANASFGPAPGFTSGATSAHVNNNQRFSSRQNHYGYDNSNNNGYAYNNSASSSRYSAAAYDYQTDMHQGFGTAANNNVSQYYTTNRSQQQQQPQQQQQQQQQPFYHRPANTFNPTNRYSSSGFARGNAGATSPNAGAATGNSSSYYQPHQSYAPYVPQQSYLNNYNAHGYPTQQPHHHQQQQQQDQSAAQQNIYSHQPYYQPYQPPHQYMSGNHQNNI